MKFCQPHWEGLRKAIDDRGLSHLVAKDGATAVTQLTQELQQGGPSKDTYDPLMAAHWAIVNNALSAGGLYLMAAKEDGSQYCPICESEAHNGYPAQWWYDNAADEQLARARELGLVGLAS